MKKLVVLIIMVVTMFTLTSCTTDADRVSENLSKEADYFGVTRQVSFINLFTGDVLFTMTGNCSVEKDVEEQQLEVTCKVGEDTYQKHFLDVHEGANVTYTVIQIEGQEVDPFRFEFVFQPETLIPITITTVEETQE
jgi:hypothetical protein